MPFIKHLRFNYDITRQEWPGVCVALKNAYPDIRWSGGREIEDGFYPGTKTLAVSLSNNHHVLSRSSLSLRNGDYGLPPGVNGSQWVKEHTVDTDDIFRQLYESEDEYRPKLSLKFDPPIKNNYEYNKVIDALLKRYPGLMWYSNEAVHEDRSFDNLVNGSEGGKICYLTIGYFPNHPDRLTFSSTYDDYRWNSLDINGWEWVDSVDINTDDIFKQLYESEEDDLDWAKQYVSSVGSRLRFKPPIGTKVRIKFNVTNNPCPDEDKDYNTTRTYEGIIVKHGDEAHSNEDDALILFNNMDWQSECGWNCRNEELGSDFRCWWVNKDIDEIYLSNHKQVRGPDTVSGVRMRESEEDEFEWVRDLMKQNPLPKRVKTGTGKRFIIPNNSSHNKGWEYFDGWNSWHPVIRIDYILGRDCYVVDLGSPYNETYVPIEDFKDSEVEFIGIVKESKNDLDIINNYKPPVGSFLTCHTDGYMVDEDGEPDYRDRFVTAGKKYKIIGYGSSHGQMGCKEALIILDNTKFQHSFGVTGCDGGPQYLRWFYPSEALLPSHEEIWNKMTESKNIY